MHNKKILILGSNSFSGASFCEYLISQKIPVIGISRSNHIEPVFHEKLSQASKAKLFTFFKFNVNSDLREIYQLIEKEKVNIIVNYAAQSMVGESWENPLDWLETNVSSLTKLIKHLEHSNHLEQFINFSTPEVYGSTDGWLREGAQFNPSTPYAVSRAAGDMMLRIFFKEKKFPVKFTRAANVYGEGQPLYRIIPRTIYSMFTPTKLQLQGGGLSERSFIHIDDVNSALVKIIEHGKFGDDYHISTSQLVSIRQLVEIICGMTGSIFSEKVDISADRAGKDQSYALDSTKIRQELQWKDEISLNNGLQRVINWIQKNIYELKNQPKQYAHKK